MSFYTEFGHGHGESQLWFLKGNDLKYSKIAAGNEIAHSTWERCTNYEVSGRIDFEKKVISINGDSEQHQYAKSILEMDFPCPFRIQRFFI